MPSTEITVTMAEGSLNNRPTARPIKAIPSTTRIKKRPAPGQPWANVENRRRKTQFSFLALFSLGNFELCGNPKKSAVTTLLGVVRERPRGGRRLNINNAAFQTDHGGMGPVMGA